MGDFILKGIKEIIPGHEPGINKKKRFIPVCEPYLCGNELKYVTRCVKEGWISSIGKYVEEFERKFAKACGAKYAVACSNGTTALHLALATLGIGPGDEVIIPAFTMIASGNAVTYTGARFKLVDSEMATWNMDISQIEKAITKRTKAIMPVHTYGHPVDMDKILKIARKHKLYVVEDAAEAHGALYKGRKIGSIGDFSCFSFYANKIITTGEGGMITTNNRKLAEKARTLRGHAFSEERHFWHKQVGFNYRMTSLQAAVGIAQTEKFSQLVNLRRSHARLYSSLLNGVEGLTLPPEASWAKNVFWMYGILVEDSFGMTRDKLRQELARAGVETRSFFVPLHFQPVYAGRFRNQRFPVAEDLCRKGFYLPSSSGLTKNEITYITNRIKNIASNLK